MLHLSSQYILYFPSIINLLYPFQLLSITILPLNFLYFLISKIDISYGFHNSSISLSKFVFYKNDKLKGRKI